MKKILILILIAIVIIPIQVQAQSQWKFHVAFEDGIGARDTIWFIWDTTATYYGADSLLGEISAEINLDEFNVWTYNKGLTWQDSIKTVALPFNYKFTQTLYASSFILPITITYDTSLFYADWLPQEPVGFVNIATISNAYFYLLGFNDLQYWDMHFSDSVLSPDYELVGNDPWSWDPNHNFPMGIAIGQDSVVDVDEQKDRIIKVYPNPSTNTLFISDIEGEFDYEIIDMWGNTVLMGSGQATNNSINIQNIRCGIYYLLINYKNRLHYEKFIKVF